MKAALERWLQARWYGGERPGLALRALGGLYRVALQSRRFEPVAVAAPVVVVGNFTAGGTGKTPLVIALAKHFSAGGWRPAVVSRGHGRRTNDAVRLDAATPADQAGDEPVLIHRLAGVPVFVDTDRVAAAQAAIAAGCDLVIADDGLQHRRLGRDIEIEVVDASRGYGNGLLLPAGPLREVPRPTDFRILTGAGAGVTGEGWPMGLRLSPQAAAVGAQAAGTRPLAGFAGAPVQAIAGIGHPARFFAALRAAGLQVDGHAFPDHHRYTAAQLRALPRPLLMTDKDAVKCAGFDLQDCWSVGVDAVLPDGFLAALDARLAQVAHRG